MTVPLVTGEPPDVTVAVSITEVGVVGSLWTLLLVKTSELEPFGLAETEVMVAAADSVVNVILHDPSDPDGLKVEPLVF